MRRCKSARERLENPYDIAARVIPDARRIRFAWARAPVVMHVMRAIKSATRNRYAIIS